MVLNRETRSKSPTKALWTKVREPRNTPSPNPATHYAKRARTFVLALLQRVGVFGRYAPYDPILARRKKGKNFRPCPFDLTRRGDRI